MGERQVPVLDHVPYLSLHSDAEQRNEVHDQYRPEHRDVEHIEERTDDPNNRTFANGVPELKLR